MLLTSQQKVSHQSAKSYMITSRLTDLSVLKDVLKEFDQNHKKLTFIT